MALKRKSLLKKLSWMLVAATVVTTAVPSTSALAAGTDNVTTEWYNFRNNQENNGVTDKNTPIDINETALKWAQKYGTGYAAAPTPPIIVNGKIYIGSGDRVLELDKETGEVLRASNPMAANVGYAMNPLIYADGKIFAQVGNGIIQAVDIETMKCVWHTENIGGQTVSPISYVEIDGTGYVYTGTWTGESRDGKFFCVTTDNENVTDGVKETLWTFMPSGNEEGVKYDEVLHATLEQEGNVAARGFYWAGAYACENYVAIGSDDGTSEGDYSANAVFYTLDPVTGDVIDRIDNIKGDIRTTTVYDNGYLYFSTKGGHMYKVPVDENGNMGEASYIDLGGMTTASPVVYKNKIYIGVCGQGGQFNADGGHGFAVVDNSTEKLSQDSLLYTIPIKGYPQAAALVSTAHVEEDYDNNGKADGRVYIYFTYNAKPGGIYYTYDAADQTEVAEISKELYIPESDKQQYCISTICTDNEGTLYYKNDSCYLFAVENNPAYVKDIAITTDNGSAAVWSESFEPGIGEYDITVAADVQTVTLEADAVEENTGVYYDTQTITFVGEETVTTSVIVYKGGKQREYVLNIRRQSNNAEMSSLLVNAQNSFSTSGSKVALYTEDFEEIKTSYVADVTNVAPAVNKFYNLWPVTADANAVVTVTAVKNISGMEEGDVIDITATDYRGNERYAIYPADITKTAVVKVTVTSESGKESNSFTVKLAKMDEFDSVTVKDQEYTGTALTPEVTVIGGVGEVVDPANYTVTYENNTEVGQATVTVTANEGTLYAGAKSTATFNIVERALAKIEVEEQFYTGKEITPAIKVYSAAGDLVDKAEYTVTFENNTEVGKATVSVVPSETSTYKGTATADFTIRKTEIAEVTLRNGSQYGYTGSQIKPTVTVKDELGKTVYSSGYTISYDNNVEVGQGTVIVTGKEGTKYTGSASVNFDILTGQISYASVNKQAYTGEEVTPAIVITDNNRKVVPTNAYTLTFENNVEIGEATFTATAVEGSGYFGTVTGTFEISKARIAKIAVQAQNYTGKEIVPAIKVYDNYGNLVPESEYDVTLKNNVEIGRAKAIITVKDDSTYRGRLVTWFVIEESEVSRVAGATRYETAFKTADALKEALGVDKFEAVIVSTGEGFADALAGSYLADVKGAPILLTSGKNVDDVKAYINENLQEGGIVYILGGEKAVPASMETGLDGYTVQRLFGANRYETNLAILEAAGVVTGSEIVVATGTNFADSLSASAAGKPILLVSEQLTDDQKAFLDETDSAKIYVIGGTSAVSADVETELKAYGTTERIGGATRYETSVLVAEKLIDAPEAAVLAYAQNFPDGLCAGPLAAVMNAPLILTETAKAADAAEYAETNGLINGVVLGGTKLISDETVRDIFKLESVDSIIVK